MTTSTTPDTEPPHPGWPGRVALHVGAHKTASTHFQKSIVLQRDAFHAAGTSLFVPWDVRPAPKLAKMMGFSYQTGGLRPTWRPEMLAEMAQGRPRLALSEENILGHMSGDKGVHLGTLYPQAADRLSALVASVAPLPVTVFLTIRDPAAYLLSAYSQSIIGGKGGTFERFVSKVMLDRLDWVDLVERILGVDRVDEVVLWKKEDYPAVAIRAADALAGAAVAEAGWFDHQAVNSSLSARAVELALAAPPGRERAEAALAARRAHPVGPDNPPPELMDAETREVSAEFYDLQWQKLAAMPRVRCLEPGRG